MLTWEDQGILLRTSPMGESQMILDVFTRHHGRWRGCYPRGGRRHIVSGLQPGNLLHVTWQARLEDQLGRWKADLIQDVVGHVMLHRETLLMLHLVTLFLSHTLSERHAYAHLYDTTVDFLTALRTDQELKSIHAQYIFWEIQVLSALGFGLDLSRCAVTGKEEDLIWVSPKSGCAASRDGARGYEACLLPLSPFLISAKEPSVDDLLNGFQLTGYFLVKHFGALPFFNNWRDMRTRLWNFAQKTFP